MSAWPNDDARPEQQWSALLALCAVTPQVLALANRRGWIGREGAVENDLSWLYFLSLPFTLALAAWALVRASRTLRSFALAGSRERALAVVTVVLTAPLVIASALAFVAIAAYGLSGGGG